MQKTLNRDDIIRMAEEAGMTPITHASTADVICSRDSLEQFAHLIAAAEREACADIAESYEPQCDSCPSGVANAIRARGQV